MVKLSTWFGVLNVQDVVTELRWRATDSTAESWEIRTYIRMYTETPGPIKYHFCLLLCSLCVLPLFLGRFEGIVHPQNSQLWHYRMHTFSMRLNE